MYFEVKIFPAIKQGENNWCNIFVYKKAVIMYAC